MAAAGIADQQPLPVKTSVRVLADWASCPVSYKNRKRQQGKIFPSSPTSLLPLLQSVQLLCFAIPRQQNHEKYSKSEFLIHTWHNLQLEHASKISQHGPHFALQFGVSSKMLKLRDQNQGQEVDVTYLKISGQDWRAAGAFDSYQVRRRELSELIQSEMKSWKFVFSLSCSAITNAPVQFDLFPQEQALIFSSLGKCSQGKTSGSQQVTKVSLQIFRMFIVKAEYLGKSHGKLHRREIIFFSLHYIALCTILYSSALKNLNTLSKAQATFWTSCLQWGTNTEWWRSVYGVAQETPYHCPDRPFTAWIYDLSCQHPHAEQPFQSSLIQSGKMQIICNWLDTQTAVILGMCQWEIHWSCPHVLLVDIFSRDTRIQKR